MVVQETRRPDPASDVGEGVACGHPVPPFAELRLIEAACRHRNYTRAARECGVTRPAVSFRVQRLEAQFGVPLFSREGVRMRPTQAAWDLARAYVEARGVLERAVEHLGAPGAVQPPSPWASFSPTLVDRAEPW